MKTVLKCEYKLRTIIFSEGTGENLCAVEPKINLWKKYKTKREALENHFTPKNRDLDDVLNLLNQTISAQCGRLPDIVRLSYIMREAYAERDRIIKTQGIHPKDFEYYQSKKAGASVAYTSIHNSQFFSKRYAQGTPLLNVEWLTSDATSLMDDSPEIRQDYVNAYSQHTRQVAATKQIRRMQRERELRQQYDPIIAIAWPMLQSFTLEFADEGFCYFFTNSGNRFSKQDFINCHDRLYDYQKSLENNQSAFYALGKLLTYMKKKQNGLVSKQSNQLSSKSNLILDNCIKGIISEINSQRYGVVPNKQALTKACSDSAIRAAFF